MHLRITPPSVMSWWRINATFQVSIILYGLPVTKALSKEAWLKGQDEKRAKSDDKALPIPLFESLS